MWCRFGTPTARAGSGTHEEFLRAIHRKKTAHTKVSLLFYFKDEPVKPSKIDPHELERVRRFQSEARVQGLLTWTFSDAYEFEKLVALHITKHVQEIRRGDGSPPSSPNLPPPLAPQDGAGVVREAELEEEKVQHEQPPPIDPDDTQDEDGYLDLLEEFTLQSAEITQVSDRLNVAQNRLTAKTTEGQQELERLQAEPSSATASAFRAAIAKVAEEMLTYTSLVNEEVPRFRQAIDRTMSSLMKLMNIAADMYPDQVREAKTAGFALLTTLIGSRTAIEGFRASTLGLPKMTKELNVAKRRQASALSALISEFEHGERLLSEGLTALSELSAGRDDA